MLLIVVQELLRALAPQHLHLMLRLPPIDPLHQRNKRLAAAALALIDLVLLNDARDALDVGFPGTGRKLGFGGCTVDLGFAAASRLFAAGLDGG